MPIWTVRFKGPHQVEFAHVETKSKDLSVAQAVAEAWAEGVRGTGGKARVIAVTPFIAADETILGAVPIPPSGSGLAGGTTSGASIPTAVQATTRPAKG